MTSISTSRNLCNTCSKVKGISKCEGCRKIFCYNHFGNHRQELNLQLEEVEVNRDVFRQTLTDLTDNPQKHAMIQNINKWEHNSIQKIQKNAEEARQLLLGHLKKRTGEIEAKLNDLTKQLRQSREENDFVETDINSWGGQINQLNNELLWPVNVKIQYETKPLVTAISVDVSDKTISIDQNRTNLRYIRWKPNGTTVAGGNDTGDRLDQLNFPWGLYIDNGDQAIYVADSYNHRIVKWNYNATSGEMVAGGNNAGNRTDQLHNPTDVILDRQSNSLIICDSTNRRVIQWPCRKGMCGRILISGVCSNGLAQDNAGYIYVSDAEKHEVKRWKIGDTTGVVVAGGNGQGNRLDQLDRPVHVFVDHEHSVYVSDQNNHRVMKWTKNAKQGTIVAGGQGEGNDLSQLSLPRGITVDQLENVYIADNGNHRIMRWAKGDAYGNILLGGNQADKHQLHYPQDLSIDRQGNLYVVDMANHRVQRFDIG